MFVANGLHQLVTDARWKTRNLVTHEQAFRYFCGDILSGDDLVHHDNDCYRLRCHALGVGAT